MLLSWWIPSSYLYDFKNYIFEIRTLQGSKWYITFLPPFKFNLSVLFRSGVSRHKSRNSAQPFAVPLYYIKELSKLGLNIVDSKSCCCSLDKILSQIIWSTYFIQIFDVISTSGNESRGIQMNSHTRDVDIFYILQIFFSTCPILVGFMIEICEKII